MSEKSSNPYEITIGIETHVQLKTKTKLFSEVDNDARGKNRTLAFLRSIMLSRVCCRA